MPPDNIMSEDFVQDVPPSEEDVAAEAEVAADIQEEEVEEDLAPEEESVEPAPAE